jgi:plastocyanin
VMHRRQFLIGATLTVLGALLSCRTGRADDSPHQWGTVKGQVVWGGDALPPRKNVDVNKDQEHCLSKGPIPDESWVINSANKGIRWAFVWLVPEPGQPKLAINPDVQLIKQSEVVIDQPCCRFEPHALALREGQQLIFKNSAPVAHNVNWTGVLKNPGSNQILPAGQSFAVKGLVADRYPLTVACNIHPWMKAWVRVFDNPYYAVTDPDGNFEIKLVPPGKCRLMVWQESVGYRGGAAGRNGTPIEIKPGMTTDLGKLDIKP